MYNIIKYMCADACPVFEESVIIIKVIITKNNVMTGFDWLGRTSCNNNNTHLLYTVCDIDVRVVENTRCIGARKRRRRKNVGNDWKKRQ